MMWNGLNHQHASLQGALQVAAGIEIKRAGRFLVVMDTLVTLAPLLGLLGTIVGLMKAFGSLGNEELAVVTVTGGIAEAQRRLEVALGAHGGKADALAIDQVAVRARSEPLAPQLFERDVKVMKEPRVVDDARVVDVREPDRCRIDEAHVRAGRCSLTPHDAGTPGQGGASFSSSIDTAARG